MKQKFKVGDLIKVIPGRSPYKDVYDPMLLISFHPEECRPGCLDGTTLTLHAYFEVLIVDKLENRYEAYLNLVGEKLNETEI